MHLSMLHFPKTQRCFFLQKAQEMTGGISWENSAEVTMSQLALYLHEGIQSALRKSLNSKTMLYQIYNHNLF